MLREDTNRYYCTDRGGKDLFYISLDDFDRLPELNISSSLGIDLAEIPSTGDLLAQIRNKYLDYGIRVYRILELFARIQEYPGIENHYFPEFTLAINGRYLEFYEQIGREILNQEIPDYTPLSDNSHPFHFQNIKQVFSEFKRQKNLTRVEQSHFEEILTESPALVIYYLEFYNVPQEFYHFQLEDGERQRWDFYSQVIEEHPVLFFFCRST